ncbi:MAG: ParA family protein [Candidatus Latescibacterota bacterium]|nr:MAG: ParA family protein [Candidatus Latescibacterota bacterium]
MRKIGITTSKGGTGKTTTAINLGHGLALCGQKVLVIDCDAQRNIAVTFDVRGKKTLCDLLQNGEVEIIQVRKNLYVVDSGGRDLAETEMMLAAKKNRESRLSRALENLKGCDVVICDCSPTINLININALAYVDEVIIPVSMDYLAQEGARQTLEIIEEINQYSSNGTQVLGILPTFYDARTKLSKEVLETLRKHFADTVFQTVIRINTSLREAPSFNRTIFEYSPLSRGAFDYYQLTEELLNSEQSQAISGERRI